MRVVKYILRRFATAIPQLLGVLIVIFFLIRLMPADPTARLLGLFSTDEAYAKAQQKLGLDRPLHEQFLSYFGGVAQGDLGNSWVTGDPIVSELARFFPVTLELIFLTFLLVVSVSLPIGMITALRPRGFWDRFSMVWGLFAGAQPEFWWGLVFVFIFYRQLGVFPAPLGRMSVVVKVPPPVTRMIIVDSILAGNWVALKSALHHMALPVGTLAFVLSGPFLKMTRQSMVNVLESDFILQARASGLRGFRLATYALRNAIAPVVTLVGVLFGWEIGGAVLIENVFSLEGLGRYAVRSTLMFDYPAIQGVVLVITAWSLLVYIGLDILYVVIDPRQTL
jgi:ABC-type dipeptide/oligopeptide/nickel transport system permease component